MSRRAFVPTAALRDKVATAAGGGMAHEEIALGLGIARGTLLKHFAHELTVGAYAKRMEVIRGLQRQAKKGNAAAVRLYLQLDPRVTVPPLPKEPPKPEKEPTVEKLGKREQAQVDATTAQVGTEWNELLRPGDTPLQ